jgi:hypothetical protein
MITLIVGGTRNKFVVHRKQLDTSAWFKNAMKEEWLVDNTISLPEELPDVLHGYLHFLYTAAIPDSVNYIALADLYVYGEKIVDLRFKNAVLGAIIQLTGSPDTEADEEGGTYWEISGCVNAMYEGTLRGSPGRQLLLDLFSCYANVDWFDYVDCPEFFYDLASARARVDKHGHEKVLESEIVAERYLEADG